MTEIFVFGSNLEGIHGAGAALHALNHHGAVMGVGNGQEGTCYAIPTKETPWKTLALHQIAEYVTEFIRWARVYEDHTYMVTPIGCGLAGYKPCEIAPLFCRLKLPDNILLPQEFIEFVPSRRERTDLIANFPNFAS